MAAALVLVALTAASAQTACSPGWTQAPPTSTWGDKCYKEFGPHTSLAHGNPIAGGHNYTSCKEACKSEVATGKPLCATSSAEIAFVAGSSNMEGWIGYTQSTAASDYSEPAGGWGWEGCSSTFVPTWYTDPYGGQQEPDNSGNGQSEGVSCSLLYDDQTLRDYPCDSGNALWAQYTCICEADAPEPHA